jgi:hypothetical protein
MRIATWQNIPYCIQVLRAINPERVLDMAVGLGHWGMMVREYCDGGTSQNHPDDWRIYLVGVETFSKNVDPSSNFLYNQIHLGDISTIDTTLGLDWNVILFNDILEHLEKNEAHDLLSWALNAGDYVLVNVPLGTNEQQFTDDAHLSKENKSEWGLQDFENLSLCARSLFVDDGHHSLGTFVLSVNDPQNIKQKLKASDGDFANSSQPANSFEITSAKMEVSLLNEQVAMLEQELSTVKRSLNYRLASRIHQSMVGKLFLWVMDRSIATARGFKKSSIVTSVPIDYARIEGINQHHSASEGSEIWLLEVVSPDKNKPIDLGQLQRWGIWEFRRKYDGKSNSCLITPGNGGVLAPAQMGSRYTFLTHPNSGRMKIVWKNYREIVDLYSYPAGKMVIDFTQQGIQTTFVPNKLTPQSDSFSMSGSVDADISKRSSTLISASTEQFSGLEQSWLEKIISTKPAAMAVMRPDWLGIRSSTIELFPHYYFVDEVVSEKLTRHRAALLLETGCERIVFSGFTKSFLHLVLQLKRLKPDIKLYNFWHGNFLQVNEPMVWDEFCTVEKLCREGVLEKLGFAKKGMAEVMAKTGLRTGFLMNRVNHIPDKASVPLKNGPSFGIWAVQPIWRKFPYAMLAAARMIPNAKVIISGSDDRARELSKLLGLNTYFHSKAVPQSQILGKLAQMDLNLYVTLSECAPMLPLESLSVGVPCLFGPNSHYFEDHPYLHSRLVVSYPDDPLTIAGYIERALPEREEIVNAYIEYAPGYNARSQQSLSDFLETEADL